MGRTMDIKPMSHGLHFLKGWFRRRNLATFREFVYPEWSNKKCCYLEVGVFEGQSLVWMLQHVLTHPDSKAVAVDPWLLTTKLGSETMEKVMQQARHNLSPWIDEEKCLLVRANSAEFLRKCLGRRGFCGLKANSVDLCMIDGNHHDLGVLDDARLCYKLVRPGGQILFDDVENDIPKKAHVKEGVAKFLEEIGDKVKFVWKDRYVECYQKVE